MAARSRWVVTASALALAALLPGCVSEAARRQGVVGTRILRWGLATRVEFQHERTDQRAQQAQRQRMVTAGFDVDADVSIYDPRLLQATIAATIAQSHAKARGPVDGTDTASVPRYYVRGDVTRGRAVSGYALAERDDDRSFSRARFIRSSVERQEAGVVGRMPGYGGYLTVRQSTVDVRGIDLSGDRTLDGRYLTAGGEMTNARSRTNVDLTLSDRDEEPTGRDDRTRQLDIVNEYKTRAAGGFPEFRFRTGVQFWRQRTNDDVQDRERLYENMDVELSDDLSSRTSFEYRTFSNSFDTENRSIRQEFQHRLFDSLVTTVGGFKSRDDFDDGRTDRFGGDAGVDYTKETFLGDLSAGFDIAKERQEDDFAGATRPVFGEGVVLQTSRTTFLREPNVVHRTVVVRDATGSLTFVLGIDYDLRRRGQRTQISRVPTGLIPDGALVLVDYEFETTGNLEFETSTRQARVSLRVLDTVTLYTRKSRVRQNELRGDGSLRLEDSDTTLYGGEFDWKGLRLSGEKERHRATFSPYKERRGTVSYDLDITDNVFVNVFRTQTRTEFEQGESLRVRTHGFTLRTTPARGLRIEAQPVWQSETGRSDDLDVLDVRVLATYSIGKIDLELLVDHREDTRGRSRVSDTRIIFSVVREW